MAQKCSVGNCHGIGRTRKGGGRYLVKGLCQTHYTRMAKGLGLDEANLRHIKDGKTKHPLYPTWFNMHQRCNNKNATSYPRYGARGIKVCDRWSGKYGFRNFLLDMGDKPSSKHSIDRIDNDGHYDPINCKWSTIKEQALNRRSNTAVSFNGTTKTISEWAADAGIKRSTLSQRFYTYKWSIEKCLLRPVRKRG